MAEIINVNRKNAVECSCLDWFENIKLVTVPIVTQAIRSGEGGYHGKRFDFCPWCGKKLEPVK